MPNPVLIRARLILGKFRVVQVGETISGLRIATIELADGYKMTIANIPNAADLRPGDLITYYGEVPISAKP